MVVTAVCRQMSNNSMKPLPPGQQLVARDKWPLVGERSPLASAEPWTLSIAGLVQNPRTWTLDELQQIPQVNRTIDLHCVTRWSKPQVPFRGISLATLLNIVQPTADAAFVSFVARSDRQHSTSLPLVDAIALDLLLALESNGAPLAVDHGGPVRVVVPNRYFYKSLKWLTRIDVLAEDRLGFWEETAGYHNVGDPWQEQRYVASGVSMQEMRRLLQSLDLSKREILGLAAAHMKLPGLDARGAVLRNADFRGAVLSGASFDEANLSNAQLAGADLRNATFIGADLEGADFAGADLRGADFSGALLTAVTFCSAFEDSPSDRETSRATIDTTTRFDADGLHALLPAQLAYVRSRTPALSR